MGKNIVLLSDGTGNSAAKLHKTNIWRVYRALDLSSDDQLAEYDDGVGTSSLRPLAMIGGAFGVGLARNVRRLYAFLSRNYRDLPGAKKEKVFAFGFSRGAYTIRMLIGLVRNQGLVDPTLPEQLFQSEVLHRWDAFRKERFRRLKRAPNEPKRLDEVKKRGHVPEFEFVGLWDTVSAYGLPIDELQHAIDLYIYPFSFSDRRVCDIVKCAYHALSLDDERRTFHPVLWDESDDRDATRLQQVWFPGVHSNIGGGYPKDGLAYVSLEWMVRKAKSLGLHFIDAEFNEIVQQVDAHDSLYNSRAGLGGYYRYSPRPVTTLGRDTLNDVTIERPKVHESVFARIHRGQVAYAPIGVPPVYDLVLRDGTVLRDENVVSGLCDAVEDATGGARVPHDWASRDESVMRDETVMPGPGDAEEDATGEPRVPHDWASRDESVMRDETVMPGPGHAVEDAAGEPRVPTIDDWASRAGTVLRDETVIRDETVMPGPGDAVEDATDGWTSRAGTVLRDETVVPRPCYVEDALEARLRATRMEAVWNLVWWRRVVYFLTLLSSLYLAALPWLAKPLSTWASFPDELSAAVKRYLAPILTVAGYLVPNWVEEMWLVTFREEPVLFLIGLVCATVTMLIGLSLEETIRSRAGEIWHASWREVPKWAQDPKSTFLYKLRSNRTVIKAYRYFAWWVLPTLFLLVCAGAIIWLLWDNREYRGYATAYAILIVVAVALRSWISRAPYLAKEKPSRTTDARPAPTR